MEFEKPTKENPFPRFEPLNVWLARKAGVIVIFERGVIFGSIRDALSYANRPRNKKKFGAYMGTVIGEVVWGDPRINFMFFEEDQRAINRKKKITRNKHLKRVGIRVWEYEKYLKANPLERYLEGKEPKRPPTEEEKQARLERRKRRDNERTR